MGSAQANTGLANNSDWLPLFNGKDLAGWVSKITGHPLGTNLAETFRVRNGKLQVSYSGYDHFNGQFGHLFFHQPFSHYAIEVSYRFVGKQLQGGPPGWARRNSGIMLHAQTPSSMQLNQEFPISIEAQLLGGLSDGKPRPTANVCTPGTHIDVANKRFTTHCLNSKAATYDGDQWVQVTIVVLGGGSITHYVQGQQVLQYSHPVLDEAASQTLSISATTPDADPPLSAGYIAIQSESHPVEFRRIRLLNLEGCTRQSSSSYRAYFIKSNPALCE